MVVFRFCSVTKQPSLIPLMNNTHKDSNNINSNDTHFEKQAILKGRSLLRAEEGGGGGEGLGAEVEEA